MYICFGTDIKKDEAFNEMWGDTVEVCLHNCYLDTLLIDQKH